MKYFHRTSVAPEEVLAGASKFFGGYDWRYIVAAIMVPGVIFGRDSQKNPCGTKPEMFWRGVSANLAMPCSCAVVVKNSERRNVAINRDFPSCWF